METVSSHLDVIDKETKQFLENKTMPKTSRFHFKVSSEWEK